MEENNSAWSTDATVNSCNQTTFHLPNFEHCQVPFDEVFCTKRFRPEVTEVEKASNSKVTELVIGMHPDQATEPLVNLAIRHRKPFAVVPCCVFAHENPGRRLKSSSR